MPIRLRARPERSAAQHGPRFAGPVPRSRRGAPPRRVDLPGAEPARNACLCACAGARSARSDQMPAGPPQGASSQATRGAAGQGRKGGEPAVFHSSFVPSATSLVRAATAASPHPITAMAPRTSPSRSCRASQSGDTPSSLPKRHRTAGRGAERQRGPAPSSLSRGSPDPHRQRRCGAVRPVRKQPAGCPCTFRPALALAAPCAGGGLYEHRICQARMCRCHDTHAAERFASVMLKTRDPPKPALDAHALQSRNPAHYLNIRLDAVSSAVSSGAARGKRAPKWAPVWAPFSAKRALFPGINVADSHGWFPHAVRRPRTAV